MHVLMPHCGRASDSTSGGEVTERELVGRLSRLGVVADVLSPRWPGLRWWNSLFWFAPPRPGWRIDLIRAHSLRYTGLPALWWGSRYDLPVTVHFHHLEQDRLSWLDRFMLRHANQVTTDSEFSARQAVGICHSHVVRLGVDHKRFRPSPIPTAPWVLLVGGRKPRKNTAFVKELWPAVRERVPGALLLEAGEGCDVTDGMYDHLMREARVVAFPSRLEGFGLPVLEAMASGRPIVCSDQGALPEFGIPTTPLHRDRWINRLVELLTNDTECRLASAQGVELARAYSWERTAETMASLWRKVTQ